MEKSSVNTMLAAEILMESFSKLLPFLQGRAIAFSEELLLKYVKRSSQGA